MSRRTNSERVVYSLTLDLPPGVSCTRMIKYLEEALRQYTFGDGFDPNLRIQPKVRLLERHVRYSS